MNYEEFSKTRETFGEGWGICAICQSCGARQKVRLKRGVRVADTPCKKCFKPSLKKAKIDSDGNILNDPLNKERKK